MGHWSIFHETKESVQKIYQLVKYSRSIHWKLWRLNGFPVVFFEEQPLAAHRLPLEYTTVMSTSTEMSEHFVQKHNITDSLRSKSVI